MTRWKNGAFAFIDSGGGSETRCCSAAVAYINNTNYYGSDFNDDDRDGGTWEFTQKTEEKRYFIAS